MKFGESCWLKRTSSGEKKPMRGDLKTTIIIIKISSNSWYGQFICKKEKKGSGVLQNEAIYKAEVMK